MVDRLRQRIVKTQPGTAELRGGLLYFPHDRQLASPAGGPVEPPAEEPQWVFQYSPTAACQAGQPDAPQVRCDRLSAGEQQMHLLFGELARRRRPGMVIAVDGIETSLHPILQRQAMWDLRQLARDCDARVIVTTHSLEVINTTRGGAFINLDYQSEL